MNDIFREKLDIFVTIYLDDILIFSKTRKEHTLHLKWVLDKLRAHKLHAKLSKCAFGLQEIEYLGHIVSARGV